ncbi:hypothetical protein LRS03_14085 [Rhizobacter sp. J219]|uniref:hypothetical protein n=1 Tax=Rhizobacter sp. J219 TaxID=2898430 RepID=UPI0021516B6C|nr:hypothetical protein [Rhizobacter sp. J219]MCR5883924.1 hypothetical protein [Rhizobacter sp. J219]
MLRMLVSAVMLLMLPVLTGCALTRTEGVYRYQPESLRLPMPPGLLSGMEVSGVVVDDARYRQDKRVLVNKRNGRAQVMSGVWAADRPLGEYTQQAFEAGMKQAGIAALADSALALRVTIHRLDERIAESGYMSIKFEMVMAVQVALVERDSGQAVWQDTFVGRSPVNARWLHFGVDDYTRSLQTTLNDLVSKVLTAPEFQRTLQAGRA